MRVRPARAPRLALLRKLTLEKATGAGRPRHLSAASGLARIGNQIYVIGDDEHHLAMFAGHDHQRRGTLVRLRCGELPPEKEERKRRKPDFESLVVLPPFGGYAHGALFAMGSGSKPNRRAAVLLELTADGSIAGQPRPIALTNWFTRFEREFAEVNLEGAFIAGKYLCLLQRGHRGNPRNARVRIALAPVLDALARRSALPAPMIEDVVDFALGAFDDAPLCFTDGAALRGGGFVFTAVAEATDDSYADGACLGAAIGIIDQDDRLRALWQLEPALKIEGIDARVRGASLVLTVVTDADRPSVAAQLLSVTLR